MKFIDSKTGQEVLGQYLELYGIRIVEEESSITSTPMLNDTVPRIKELITCSKNNGGTTDYYALPLPAVEKLIDILDMFSEGTIDQSTTIDLIRLSCISTLNDLIEYRDMPFWEGEILKAIYALHQRANKDIKGGGILRELNKIIYYAGRGIALAKAGKI